MPPPQQDLPNQDLIERVPLTARVVLDVGCASAALAAFYRKRNPRARLLGIDKDPDVASVAIERLDELAIVDVENDPLPFDVSEGIDCIVYGDILEHLRDPWAVLTRQAEALTPDGMILMCVPNVEHWSFTDRLLRGVWDYEATGLFDKSHLRWFSLRNMQQGLEQCGFVLCDAIPRVFPFDREPGAKFAQAITPALTALGVNADDYIRRAMPLQYVWRARKTPRQRMVVAGNMLKPVGGVSHVRVVHPLRAMATDPLVSTMVTTSVEGSGGNDNTARIFILHRPSLAGEEGRKMVRYFIDAGWLVVTEFDDHPDFFPMMHDAHQLTFRGVHAVQTSTRALAAVLRQRNPEVAVFPNAIVELPDIRNFADPNVLTVFFGALNREQDWEPLMDTINAVAAQAGDRLRFSVVYDRGFYDALQTPHKQFVPLCEYDTYMELLGRCEVSLMPLSDGGFNRAKSDLKFIEAGACRVASLASDTVYGETIEEGRNGLLFRDASELRAKLMRLVAMPDLARDLGDAARDYVAQNRMLAYQIAPRIAWYRSLWSRREALTAALEERLAAVPEPAL
ncbi:MAG TPA: methyltransferase domain-containing protein [Acetobacteraceae bacterium]|nr:methyltransferase domain-containing protein [Acetobacteraceae bacterium]